jgi:pyruvate dehydrogenase E2 component (dihydrolipoamide acetyltransferase)/2-oxoglutarate dehydrogenase E2 component (dihydrolipoamide succinyltransferase)
MVEATITEWKEPEGASVEKDQPILVIEMEKTSYDLGAIASGILHIITPPGETVPVGHVVGVLAESPEEYTRVAKEAPPVAAVEATANPEAAEPVAATAPAEAVEEAPRATAPGQEKVRISPVARTLAEEHGIDISRVSGSGPGGRIVKEDILRAVEEKAKAPAAPVAAPAPTAPAPVAPSTDAAELAGIKRAKEVIPLRGMRKVIADNMVRSLQVAAQMSSAGEADATELIKFRQSLVDRQESIGIRITYADIFVMVAAKALKQNPMFNCSIVGDEIRLWDDINIGVAVAMELEETPGLVVPVVHNADKKSLVEIHNTLISLSQKARDRTLLPDEVAGSTFTITSTGGAGGGGIGEGGGSGFGTPVINLPEVAILGLGGIVNRPVVQGGEIVIRPMIGLTLTVDHRVIDGVPAGRFMGTVARYLMDPYMMLVY